MTPEQTDSTVAEVGSRSSARGVCGGDLGGDVLERVRRLEADARATSSKLDALLAHLKVLYWESLEEGRATKEVVETLVECADIALDELDAPAEENCSSSAAFVISELGDVTSADSAGFFEPLNASNRPIAAIYSTNLVQYNSIQSNAYWYSKTFEKKTGSTRVLLPGSPR